LQLWRAQPVAQSLAPHALEDVELIVSYAI